MKESIKEFIADKFFKNNVSINPKVKYIAVDADGWVFGYSRYPIIDESKKIWFIAQDSDFIQSFKYESKFDNKIYVPVSMIDDFRKEITNADSIRNRIQAKIKAAHKLENNNEEKEKGKDMSKTAESLIKRLKPIFLAGREINPYFATKFGYIAYTESKILKDSVEYAAFLNPVVFRFSWMNSDPNKAFQVILSHEEFCRWWNKGLMLDSWWFDPEECCSNIYEIKERRILTHDVIIYDDNEDEQ